MAKRDKRPPGYSKKVWGQKVAPKPAKRQTAKESATAKACDEFSARWSMRSPPLHQGQRDMTYFKDTYTVAAPNVNDKLAAMSGNISAEMAKLFEDKMMAYLTNAGVAPPPTTITVDTIREAQKLMMVHSGGSTDGDWPPRYTRASDIFKDERKSWFDGHWMAAGGLKMIHGQAKTRLWGIDEAYTSGALCQQIGGFGPCIIPSGGAAEVLEFETPVEP